MPAAKLKSIDTKSIKNFKKLLNELHVLNRALPGSELYKLDTFNSAYIVITTAIEEASDNGHFENPKFIERFTLNFSSYYFQIINNTIAGNDDVPAAWSSLITSKKTRQLPNFIYLLLGANAHINHDLALVMVELLDNDDTENLLKDIIKVDKILADSGKDILRTFTETKKLPRFIKNKTSYVYLPIIMYIILYWRVKAFKDYLSIKNKGISQERAHIQGVVTSSRLLKLGKLLS
jgi:hypothetical protein